MGLRRMFGFLLLAGLALGAERGQEIKLWPSGAPGFEDQMAPETSKPSTNPKYSGLPPSRGFGKSTWYLPSLLLL